MSRIKQLADGALDAVRKYTPRKQVSVNLLMHPDRWITKPSLVQGDKGTTFQFLGLILGLYDEVELEAAKEGDDAGTVADEQKG